MTTRELMEAALEGEQVPRIPYSAYHWIVQHRENWQWLIDMGLGYAQHATVVEYASPGVDYRHESYTEDGHRFERHEIVTPVGAVDSLYMDGWPQTYYLNPIIVPLWNGRDFPDDIWRVYCGLPARQEP